jgi:amino acid transporter
MYSPGVLDGWAFGIVIVIGGQFIGWNEGLEAGFGSFFIGTFLVGIAFFNLVLCLAEISSALPFPGLSLCLSISLSPHLHSSLQVLVSVSLALLSDTILDSSLAPSSLLSTSYTSSPLFSFSVNTSLNSPTSLPHLNLCGGSFSSSSPSHTLFPLTPSSGK